MTSTLTSHTWLEKMTRMCSKEKSSKAVAGKISAISCSAAYVPMNSNTKADPTSDSAVYAHTSENNNITI